MTQGPDNNDIDPFLEARRRLATKMEELRSDSNLTQRQAARETGMTQSTWRRMELKLHDPSLAQLLRIQRRFALDSIDSFFGPGATARLLGVPEPATATPHQSKHGRGSATSEQETEGDDPA